MGKMPKNKGAIVILGGMGPEASAKMLEVMISMATREFGAKNGQDFPEIIVDSVPIPDFISSKKSIALASKMLKTRVKRLATLDISCFAIACNTAHIMLDTLASVSTAPFISMIDATTQEVKKSEIKSVGVLATPSTIESGLYQKALQKLGIKIILPSNEQISAMESIIRKVIAGKNTSGNPKRLAQIADSLKARGAQAVILGCTELPLLFPKDFTLPVFDSIEILSRTLLGNFYCQKL